MSHTPTRNSGSFVNGVHHLTFPVYYEDTDAGGVVYYANYLRFAERGRTEALQRAGLDHIKLMEEHGVWFVARRCVIDYLKPARLDDLLTVKTSITEIRNTSLVMRQVVTNTLNPDAPQDIAVIDAFMVCVNADVRPQKFPPHVKDTLLKFMPVQEHEPQD